MKLVSDISPVTDILEERFDQFDLRFSSSIYLLHFQV